MLSQLSSATKDAQKFHCPGSHRYWKWHLDTPRPALMCWLPITGHAEFCISETMSDTEEQNTVWESMREHTVYLLRKS